MSTRETELEQLLNRALEQIQRLELENKHLREKLHTLISRVFDRKSEKLDDRQMLLLLQGLEDEAKKPESPASAAPADDRAKKKPRAARKPSFPANLPVEETIIDPGEVLAAPEQFRCIGAETSDQYDYEPAKFLVRRIIRRKFARVDAPHLPPVIAPLPAKIKERHSAGPGLLAAIAAGKYRDHLPLYRLQGIFHDRHGVSLPRQTMCLWLEDMADWLMLIYLHIRSEVFGGGYFQMDETPVRVLAPGTGRTAKKYLFCALRPGVAVCYDWGDGGRGGGRLDGFIPADFTGKAQTDGYIIYENHARDNPGRIELIHCWAHARREFKDAAEAGCRRSAVVLNLIGHLYEVEAKLRERKAGPALREATRASESAPVLRRIFRLLQAWRTRGRMLPAAQTFKAMEYTLKREGGLAGYLGDGLVEIDNNLVENKIRPIAVGRKNWLFFGSLEAGQTSAVMMTIVENCKMAEVDAFHYLRDVFSNVGVITNRNIADWTPAGWSKRHGLSRAARAMA